MLEIPSYLGESDEQISSPDSFSVEARREISPTPLAPEVELRHNQAKTGTSVHASHQVGMHTSEIINGSSSEACSSLATSEQTATSPNPGPFYILQQQQAFEQARLAAAGNSLKQNSLLNQAKIDASSSTHLHMSSITTGSQATSSFPSSSPDMSEQTQARITATSVLTNRHLFPFSSNQLLAVDRAMRELASETAQVDGMSPKQGNPTAKKNKGHKRHKTKRPPEEQPVKRGTKRKEEQPLTQVQVVGMGFFSNLQDSDPNGQVLGVTETKKKKLGRRRGAKTKKPDPLEGVGWFLLWTDE